MRLNGDVGQNVLIILTCISQNVSFLMRHFVLVTFFVGLLCQNILQLLIYHYVIDKNISNTFGIMIALMAMSLFV